jgi:hypothetical protein
MIDFFMKNNILMLEEAFGYHYYYSELNRILLIHNSQTLYDFFKPDPLF